VIFSGGVISAPEKKNLASLAGQWAHVGFEYVILSYIWNELHSHVFHEAKCNMIQNGKKRKFHPDISAIVEGDLKNMFEKNLESVLSKELTIRGFRGAKLQAELDRLKRDIKQINIDFFSGAEFEYILAKTKKGYQGDHKLNLIVLTGDQVVPQLPLDEIPRSDHVFVITKTQLFRLFGIGLESSYARQFTEAHHSYSGALTSGEKFFKLMVTSKRVWEKGIAELNEIYLTSENFGLDSDGYEKFCTDFHKEYLFLYTDYALPPSDQIQSVSEEEDDDDTNDQGGLPENYLGKPDKNH
jgi:hypothetical protein